MEVAQGQPFATRRPLAISGRNGLRFPQLGAFWAQGLDNKLGAKLRPFFPLPSAAAFG